jgi:hypothetical protein
MEERTNFREQNPYLDYQNERSTLSSDRKQLFNDDTSKFSSHRPLSRVPPHGSRVFVLYSLFSIMSLGYFRLKTTTSSYTTDFKQSCCMKVVVLLVPRYISTIGRASRFGGWFHVFAFSRRGWMVYFLL